MSRGAERLVWAAFFLAQLAPVWALPYFPTQDGPSHLENSNILLLLLRGGAPAFSQYFSINTAPTPNWLGHAALAGLMLLAGPLIAEKLLLTVYIVALPLAVRYAFRAARPEAGPLAVLSFPFLYNCLLHYGFYNFCLSIALFFVALGYRRGRKGDSGWKETAALAAILAVLYGCHVVSWALALLAMVILRPRQAVPLALAAAPSAGMAIWFFAGRHGGSAGPAVPLAARWSGLWHFSTAVSSYGAPDQWIGTAFALFLLCAAIVCAAKGPALFSALLLIFYFAIPPQAFGGMFLLERLNLYFFLSLLPWIAERDWSRGARRILVAGAALFCLALLALNMPWYLEANRLIAEFLSGAGHVRTGSVFVPLIYEARGPGPMRRLYGEPLRHTSGYLAVLRGAVNLDNYEAQTDLFPVKFRPDHNPGVLVGAMEESPPRVHLDPSRIDYVVVWDPARLAPPPALEFKPVFESASGALRIFESHR
ncbi:MAG TPA: hypothetical protein VL285_15845 [Bryobacteraceae bacterium]|nr:hypothetical protein [Bryobacteraceae bacterium]